MKKVYLVAITLLIYNSNILTSKQYYTNNNTNCPGSVDPIPEYFCDPQYMQKPKPQHYYYNPNCKLPPATHLPPRVDQSFGANPARTIFIPRSIGDDTARQLVGWQNYIHLCDEPNNYITTGHMAGYNKSFRGERISKYLFHTGGSPCFPQLLSARPSISTAYLDNQFYFGLNRYIDKFYVIITAPLAYTTWDLNILPDKESKKLISMQKKWKYGKIPLKPLHKTAVADVKFYVGYDTYQDAESHFGFFGLLVAPTGNKPDPKYLFSPIVGNAHRWELGGGIIGHMLLWERGVNQALNIWVDGNVTHPFQVEQKRSFDIKHQGPLSRYQTLKEYKRVNGKLVFTGKTTNAINICTKKATVSLAVRGDISAKLAYRQEAWELDLGYNFYGNTQEKAKLANNNTNNNKNNEIVYVLKEQNGHHEIITADSLYLPTGAAGPSATHKIFTHLNYNFDTYREPDTISPYLGIGGDFEVEGLACNDQSSLNQWGVWVKGGVLF